jgi:hypothetical protein
VNLTGVAAWLFTAMKPDVSAPASIRPTANEKVTRSRRRRDRPRVRELPTSGT